MWCRTFNELVAELPKKVEKIDAAVADATAACDKFLLAKGVSLSGKARVAAMSALRKYYEGAALVQIKS